ncbi:MAG: OmpA family protein [Granulosicoccus sp.]
MKKLLLTAVVALGLGGGAWKYQNPEGTLDDLQSQAVSTADRLKVGFNAIRESKPGLIEKNAALAVDQNNTQAEANAALNSRLAKLEEAILSPNNTESANEIIAPTTATQASIQSIIDGEDEKLARIDTIDKRLDLLMRRLDEQTFGGDIAGIQEGLQTLGADVLALQSDVAQQQAKIASDIASVEERSKSLDSRLDTLAALAQQTQESSAAAEGSDSAPSSVALASLSAGIDKRFGSLEEKLQTVNVDSRRVGNLNDQLQSLSTDIASIKSQNEESDRVLASITSDIEKLKTTSESLSIETVQAEIRDQLARAQTQLENTLEDQSSSELEALIDTTKGRIRSLEQRVQELPASSSEADNALKIQSALESQISALERRLESVNRTDPELANTLSNVQEKVEQLASQSFVTQEELRARSEGRKVEYKIFFDTNSSNITADAAKVLNSFIAQEKNRTLGVSIFGFTDRSGSAFYNQKLAELRATNVRSYLIQNGMDYTKIKALTGLGEDAAAAVLPDNAKDSQQRVVVLYSEQP